MGHECYPWGLPLSAFLTQRMLCVVFVYFSSICYIVFICYPAYPNCNRSLIIGQLENAFPFLSSLVYCFDGSTFM